MNEMLRQYINLKSNISLVSGILSLQEAVVAVKIKFQYFLFFFSALFLLFVVFSISSNGQTAVSISFAFYRTWSNDRPFDKVCRFEPVKAVRS